MKNNAVDFFGFLLGKSCLRIGLLLFLMVAITALSNAGKVVADLASKNIKDNEVARNAAISILSNLQKQARSRGMSNALPVGKTGKTAFDSELGGWKNVISIQVFSSQDFGGKSPYWWINLAGADLQPKEIAFRPPFIRRDTPFTSQKNQEWAIKQAEVFCITLRPLGISDLRLESAEFCQDVNHRYDPACFMSGFWRIVFRRFSKAGFAVVKNSLTVEVDEDYGIRGYNDDCITIVDENTLVDAKIDKATIRLAAIESAKKVMAESPVVRGYFDHYTLVESPFDQHLAVARPNKLLTCTNFAEIWRDEKGCLVWIISFRLNGPGKLAPGVLHIYIDAQTGKFVGGSC